MKYVIFDFNGTILNDCDLGLELINEFLEDDNKPLIDMDKYKNIFGFPIIDYYRRAGLEIDDEKFGRLAIVYNDKYNKRIKDVKLFSNVIDVLKSLLDKGVELILLSATEKNNLVNQAKYYDIYDYFKDILGTDNYHGSSKVNIGKKYIKQNNINPVDCLIVGDSTHDYEVSQEIGAKCLLFSQGHQSRTVLSKTGATIIDSLDEIEKYI